MTVLQPARNFWPGETIRVGLTFTNDLGAPMAATGVAVTYKPAGGAVLSASVVPGATTGKFQADILATNTPGFWAVRAVCTGPTAAAVESTFRVTDSAVL